MKKKLRAVRTAETQNQQNSKAALSSPPICFSQVGNEWRGRGVFLEGEVALLEWDARFPCPAAPEACETNAGDGSAPHHDETPAQHGNAVKTIHTGTRTAARGFVPAASSGKTTRTRAPNGTARHTAAGYAAIAAFYKELAEQTGVGICQVLLPRAREEYLSSDRPRKRYTFPRYRLFLRFHVTQDADGCYSVRRESVLSRGGQILSVREAAEIFLTDSGRICSPVYLHRRGVPLSDPGDPSLPGGNGSMQSLKKKQTERENIGGTAQPPDKRADTTGTSGKQERAGGPGAENKTALRRMPRQSARGASAGQKVRRDSSHTTNSDTAQRRNTGRNGEECGGAAPTDPAAGAPTQKSKPSSFFLCLRRLSSFFTRTRIRGYRFFLRDGRLVPLPPDSHPGRRMHDAHTPRTK